MNQEDIETLMLNTLLGKKAITPAKVCVEEQKGYLKKHTHMLTFEDKRAIGNLIIAHGYKNELKWCMEGTIINLSMLTPELIESIYELMFYKINRR